jgi:hypothetical protein
MHAWLSVEHIDHCIDWGGRPMQGGVTLCCMGPQVSHGMSFCSLQLFVQAQLPHEYARPSTTMQIHACIDRSR